jgi:hypothetical protein
MTEPNKTPPGWPEWLTPPDQVPRRGDGERFVVAVLAAITILWWTVGAMSVIIIWADTYVAGQADTGTTAAVIWAVGALAWPIVLWWTLRRTDPRRRK